MLLLLDLNMPKHNGREVLRDVQADQQLRRLPVVVFTTSRAEKDVEMSYDLGANSYIVKPTLFSDLVRVVQTVGAYWLQTVRLPPPPQGRE